MHGLALGPGHGLSYAHFSESIPKYLEMVLHSQSYLGDISMGQFLGERNEMRISGGEKCAKLQGAPLVITENKGLGLLCVWAKCFLLGLA